MSTSTSASRLQELLPQLFQANLPPGEPYLRFQLTAEMTALMSMERVRESLFVSAELITPLPNMPESVIGIMSSRNHVFCVIDLAQMLMLPSTLISSRQYHVVVLRVSRNTISPNSYEEILLGIAVNRIQGITRLTSEKITSPRGDFPPSLTPYLRGCLVEKEKQVLVLDFQAIATASPLGEIE
jgi:twitching motility protein PilI